MVGKKANKNRGKGGGKEKLKERNKGHVKRSGREDRNEGKPQISLKNVTYGVHSCCKNNQSRAKNLWREEENFSENEEGVL